MPVDQTSTETCQVSKPAPTLPPPNTTSQIIVIIKSLYVVFGGGAEGGGGILQPSYIPFDGESKSALNLLNFRTQTVLEFFTNARMPPTFVDGFLPCQYKTHPHPASPKYDSKILMIIKSLYVVFGGGAGGGGGILQPSYIPFDVGDQQYLNIGD